MKKNPQLDATLTQENTPSTTTQASGAAAETVTPLFTTRFPNLAACVEDDIAQLTTREVRKHPPLTWVCPKCGRSIKAGLNVVLGRAPGVDDPNLLVGRCDACSGRTLLAFPTLSRQFVSCGETGETDPGRIVPGTSAASRNKLTLWQCETCDEQFRMSVRTAKSLMVRTGGVGVLHKPCQVAPAQAPQAPQRSLLCDRIHPKTGVHTGDLYRPLFLGPVADGPTDFAQVTTYSARLFRWTCPIHTGVVWEATPQHFVKATEGLWLSRCPKCVAARGLFVTAYPKLAAQAIDDVRTLTTHDVLQHSMRWSCPNCDRPLKVSLSVAFGYKRGADDPDLLVARCPACTGRTLLSMPALARQFVRHGETGETDPGLIVPDQTATSRNRETLWCCEHCHQQFHLAVYTAADIYRRTGGQCVLHADCRPEAFDAMAARLAKQVSHT